LQRVVVDNKMQGKSDQPY